MTSKGMTGKGLMLMAIVGVLLTAACAPTMYVHETKNTREFEKDFYRCKGTVAQRATMMGLDPFIAQMAGGNMQECMRLEHGWEVQRKG